MQAAQLLGQPLALGRATLDELVEGASQRCLQQGPGHRRLDRLAVLQPHDPGALEEPLQRDAAREVGVVELVCQRTGAGGVFPGQREVGDHPLRGLPGDRRGHHGGVDPTALDPGRDELARVDLERGERARQTQGHVEVPVIDRARLDDNDERVAPHLRTAEPGHAPDHRVLQNG